MCVPIDPVCVGSEVVSSITSDAINDLAKSVAEGFGQAVATVGTIWVNIGTPTLTGSGGSDRVAAGETAPGAEGVTTVLGYAMWIGFAVCALSMIAFGVLLAVRRQQGAGFMSVGRLGVVLGATMLISGSAGLVGALLPSGPQGSGGAVAFLQNGLWWFTIALAILAVILGAVKMAWQHRAEPGKELVAAMLTLIVVSSSALTAVGLLVTAFDAWSVWLINKSTECPVDQDGGSCFGANIMAMIALPSNPVGAPLGSLLIILLGLVAIFVTFIQIVLMVARGGSLVLLAGILPTSSAFTNTEMGKSWYKKNVGWLIAFILYKPAAAVVYSAAFMLTGTDVFKDDGSGLLSILTGLLLMMLALFALPVLMRFVSPMVSAVGGGVAGGMFAAAALNAMPSGALSSAHNGAASGAQGAAGQHGPSGASASTPSVPSGGGGASASSSGGGGGAATGGGSAAAASGSGAAAAGGGAAAAGAGGGAVAAGSAAGPVGAAAGAGVEVAKKGADGARALSQQATDGGAQ